MFDLSPFSADVAHWAKVATWSRDEIVALSLGKDPRRVTWEKVSTRVNETAFTREYSARRMIVERSYGARQLSYQTPPAKVLEWAKRINLSMPADLVIAVEAIGDIRADQRSEGDRLFAEMNVSSDDAPAERQEKDLSTRERESLLKMIIAMAVKGYVYKPTTRNSTSKEIAEDIQLLGLPLSEDTIRKYLQEASELLPAAETEQKR